MELSKAASDPAHVAGELARRLIQATDPHEVDEISRRLEAAVAAMPDGARDRAILLSFISDKYRERFAKTGSRAALDHWAAAARHAAHSAASDLPDVAMYFVELADSLLSRSRATGALDDLDEAIESAAAGLAAAGPDGRGADLLFLRLHEARERRYEISGTLNPESAVSAARLISQRVPDGHAWKPRCLVDLAIALQLRFARFAREVDLNEAIAVCRQAHALLPDVTDETANVLCELGLALKSRYDLTGDVESLAESIGALRESLAISGQDAGLGLNLAEALRVRYELHGTLSDLDESIAILRSVRPLADDSEVALVSAALATSLEARFERVNEPADLDQAIAEFKACLSRLSIGHASRPAIQSNLGTAYFRRYEHGIAEPRLAVKHGPVIVAGLLRRVAMRSPMTDLDLAIATWRDCVLQLPADHPARGRSLSGLSGALCLRFDQAHHPGDLAAAIAAGQEATNDPAAAPPELAGRIINLADGLRRRFDAYADGSDAEKACHLYRTVATSPASSPLTRLNASARWATFACEARLGWDMALQAYAIAIAQLPLVAWHGADRADQEWRLADWPGLASDAAACAIEAGDLHRAVQLLEQGRSVIWANAVRSFTDLIDLTGVPVPLAEKYRQIQAGLQNTDHMPPGLARDRRLELTQQLDALGTEIAKSLHEEQQETHTLQYLPGPIPDGPVIIVNVSRWRCDALAATPQGIHLIPLPQMEHASALERTDRYLRTLQNMDTGSSLKAADRETEQLLGWLWDSLAAPVLANLTQRGTNLTRLWWCPTGPLTLLPLHAAGWHKRPGGQSLMDHVISSYTPTLTALAHALKAPSQSPPDRGTLIVAMPQTPGEPDLPFVTAERDMIAGQHSTLRHTVLEGPTATHRNVIAALPHHDWVHLACHGSQDLYQPSDGGLILHDEILTIAELARRHEPHELGFLSACKTATGGAVNPDEAISLAAALQYTGCRQVIGTLWSVSDEVAATIAGSVYRHLATHGARTAPPAAEALHLATKTLREQHKATASLWASFIHIGI